MDKSGSIMFGREEGRSGRRRYAQTSMPTLYFRDGILSIPGYAFEKVRRIKLAAANTTSETYPRPGGPLGGHRVVDAARRG
jgi:hypothetical protein